MVRYEADRVKPYVKGLNLTSFKYLRNAVTVHLGFGLSYTPMLIAVSIPILLAIVLLYYIRANRSGKIRDRLVKHRSDIIQAHQELNDLLNSDRYVERRAIDSWTKKWAFLASVLRDSTRHRIADANLIEKIGRLLNAFENIEEVISKRNEDFIQQEAKRFEWLFNSIEKYPLTKSQIRSIITDEYFNLVVAGAGTGKTSTIVGKAAYIIEKGLAKPEEVLLLSFARDAKEEMYKRTNSRLKLNLKVKTFHSLGLSIIAEVEEKTPPVSKLSTDKIKLDKRIEEFIRENLHDELFSKLLNEYFLFHIYPYESIFNFKNRGEYIDYLKKHEVRSLKGDIVKSLEECEIANFLYVNGIEYEYERDYEVKTSSKEHIQYRPDFYLATYGVYIEHFAIDENGNTPSFIDKDIYVEEIAWKRQLHKANGTKLIETYSHEKKNGILLINLEAKLRRENVEIKRIPEEKVFEEINKLGYISPFASLLSTFLNLYKSSHLEINDLKEKAKRFHLRERSQAFIDIFAYVLTAYNNCLISQSEVDFNDMILFSERYVAENRYQSKYRYILVDEFQDISQSRYRLLKALVEQRADCKLFCVGDDWQSIFRFNGSDLSLMTHFQEYFGATEFSALDKTFRFNDGICDFSNKFILQNPNQLSKRLVTNEKTEKQTVKIILTESENETMLKILEEINSKSLKKTEVFIIGRYTYQQPDNLDELRRNFPRISIRYMTAHSSKGTEADYVILIGLKSGLYGFPCQIEDDPLLNLVLAKQDSFPNSEERRLFYVVVTRAKKEVYLLADTKSKSEFVTEVLKEGYNVNVIGKNSDKMKCPECVTGHIELVNWKYGPFYSCSNYPYCEYKPKVCPKCDNGFLQKENRFEYICINDYCGFRAKICPSCKDGFMKVIKGPYSDFMGCSNFPECRYKEKLKISARWIKI